MTLIGFYRIYPCVNNLTSPSSREKTGKTVGGSKIRTRPYRRRPLLVVTRVFSPHQKSIRSYKLIVVEGFVCCPFVFSAKFYFENSGSHFRIIATRWPIVRENEFPLATTREQKFPRSDGVSATEINYRR